MNEPTQAMPSGQGEPVVISDRYRLVSLLGRGGTAEVWRAEDDALGRSVALKLVTVPTDEGAARAGDEARLLARLSHPGLVPVYDAGLDERGRPWVVMELVEGQTLADTIKAGPVDPVRCAEIGRSVAAALAYVHTQGLLHRDVKPGNVLMGADGSVRLTDFGIARLVDAARVTSTGMMVGTASYLAPEQVAGEPVGPPADIYALGLVLLECLTGQREYAGSTVEVALARLQRQPQVPRTLPAGWPGLLIAMTARDPALRPTPAAAAQELAAIAVGGQATTVLAAPVSRPISEPAPGWDRTSVLPRVTAGPSTTAAPRPVAARRSRLPYALSALALLVAVVGGLLFVQSQGGSSGQLPTISPSVPAQLREDLQRLRDEVEP